MHVGCLDMIYHTKWIGPYIIFDYIYICEFMLKWLPKQGPLQEMRN